MQASTLGNSLWESHPCSLPFAVKHLGRLQSEIVVVVEEVAGGRVGRGAGHDDPGDFNRGAWKRLPHTQEKNTGCGSGLSSSALVQVDSCQIYTDPEREWCSHVL